MSSNKISILAVVIWFGSFLHTDYNDVLGTMGITEAEGKLNITFLFLLQVDLILLKKLIYRLKINP